MENLQKKLLEYLEQRNYNGRDIFAISKDLNINRDDLFPIIEALEKEGIIFSSKKKEYFLATRFGLVKAKVVKVFKKFGIVRYYDEKSSEEKDLRVEDADMKDAFCYDSVLIKPLDERYASIFKVLERGNEFVVGEFHSSKRDYVVPDDEYLPFRIYIAKGDNLKAVEGHKVVVNIVDFDKEIRGKIQKILGHKNDPRVDIMSIIYKHQVPVEFEDDVLKEASEKSKEISLEDLKHRLDLRSHLIFTIDGEDAKDLDDAIEMKILDNGNYELGVHIADVSNYVTKGSLIDKDAFQRGTSIYMADYVIPMLPHILSNGICSLNPNEDRLTMSCIMEINKAGKVVNYKITPSVIRSKYRLNYTLTNKFFANEHEYDPELALMLTNMLELSKILQNVRKERGAIELNAPEAKVILNEEGKCVDVVLRTQGIAEKLIEDFMVVANETTATHVFWQQLPYIYRVHDKPKQKSMSIFNMQISPLGYKVVGDKNGVHPKTLQALLERIQGKPEELVITTLMLRSFAKAKYDSVNIGHFGLGSKCYSHFTSPIRRYPDLLAHRLLKMYAKPQKINYEELLEEVTYIAMQNSISERKADQIERDVEDMKKAEYMEDKIGFVYDGIVSGIIMSGFFVELPNTIEGLVKFESMDDYFEFDEKRMVAIGQGSHQVIALGDKVKIKVKATDKKSAQIDFTFIRKLK